MLYQDALLKRLEASVRAALPEWSLSDKAAVRLLTISENATYLVEAPSDRLVIRVYRPGYHTQAEISSELSWIAALRQAGLETPRPVPGKDGALLRSFQDGSNRRYMVAFEFITGKEPDPSDDLVTCYRRLGEISACLHAHSRRWVRPPGFVRKRWDFDKLVGAGAYWGDWRKARSLDAAGRRILEQTVEKLREETARFGRERQGFGLIHCDMRPANLLLDGERLVLIDFDDCGFSWFLYDFAASVSFLEHEPFLPNLMAAWVDGYRRVAPLSAAEEAALPILVMLRRLQLTAWIASHAETPTAQAMGAPYTEGTLALAERYLSRR